MMSSSSGGGKSKIVIVVIVLIGALFFGLACVGVLAAVAVPSFIKYQRRSQSVEAQINLRTIADGLRAYRLSEHYSKEGDKLPASWPVSAGPTPGDVCCGKCLTPDAEWQQPGWEAINFAIPDPHRYSYQMVSKGDTVHLTARGDLDCDGETSLFSMDLRADGEDVTSTPVFIENETE